MTRFGRFSKDRAGTSARGWPILLILDDFEALLDPPLDGGHWRVKAGAVTSLTAIVRAFYQGGTDSRLLITSRYTFPLAADGRDLAARLLRIQLPQMSEAAALKQARQKAFASFDTAAESKIRDVADLTTRAMTAARGNAGLQDILFQAVMADRNAGMIAIEALEHFLAGGDLPAAGTLRETLEKLAIDRLISALSEGERELLRASTLSPVPLPIEVWRGFAADAGYGAPDWLLAFGLWERLPDLVETGRDAAVRNAIAGERIGPLAEAAARDVAAAIVPRLYQAWGGIENARHSRVASLQLATLALLAENVEVVEAAAVHAIRALEVRRCVPPSRQLRNELHYGAEAGRSQSLARPASRRSRNVRPRRRRRRAAPDLGGRRKDRGLAGRSRMRPDERRSRAQLRVRYSSHLVGQGRPDEGLRAAEAARDAFEALGDQLARAVTLATSRASRRRRARWTPPSPSTKSR